METTEKPIDGIASQMQGMDIYLGLKCAFFAEDLLVGVEAIRLQPIYCTRPLQFVSFAGTRNDIF